MAALKKKALWQVWSQQTGTEQQVWINLAEKDLPRRRDRDTNGQFVRGAIDDEVPLAAIIEHATLFKSKEVPELVVPTKFTKRELRNIGVAFLSQCSDALSDSAPNDYTSPATTAVKRLATAVSLMSGSSGTRWKK